MKYEMQTKRNLAACWTVMVVLATGLAPIASAKKPTPPPPEDAAYTAESIGMAGFGINDAGQVVGISNYTAALITPADCDGDGDLDWFCDDGEGVNSLIQYLGTLYPGDWMSQAEAVNASGQVVGWSVPESGDAQAFIWDSINGMVPLGTLGGDESYSSPWDINASGQVVGQATSGDYYPEYDYYSRHAFVWENGVMVDLGTLGGAESAAHAINDAGQVVGVAQNRDGFDRAFLVEADNGVWFRDTNGDGANDLMVDLGTFGGDVSAANGINDLGEVVGHASDSRGNTLPFLYSGGSMSILEPLLPEGNAHCLNNSAQILGASVKSRGGPRPTGATSIQTNTFWENGVATPFSELIDTDLGRWGGEDINESGQFVSYSGHIMHPLP